LSPVQTINAITLATHDMARAVRFYRTLGLEVIYGGEETSFTSLKGEGCFVNLTLQGPERRWSWWGRVIFHVTDVDGLYRRALENGLSPDTAPRDAEWGERYFHVTDPDGHELSFAKPLGVPARQPG